MGKKGRTARLRSNITGSYNKKSVYITIDDEIQLCLGTQSFMLAITQTIREQLIINKTNLKIYISQTGE